MNTIVRIDEASKSIYEKFYGRKLSNQEMFEIKQNLMGLFELLIKLDKKTKSKKSGFATP